MYSSIHRSGQVVTDHDALHLLSSCAESNQIEKLLHLDLVLGFKICLDRLLSGCRIPGLKAKALPLSFAALHIEDGIAAEAGESTRNASLSSDSSPDLLLSDQRINELDRGLLLPLAQTLEGSETLEEADVLDFELLLARAITTE